MMVLRTTGSETCLIAMVTWLPWQKMIHQQLLGMSLISLILFSQQKFYQYAYRVSQKIVPSFEIQPVKQRTP